MQQVARALVLTVVVLLGVKLAATIIAASTGTLVALLIFTLIGAWLMNGRPHK